MRTKLFLLAAAIAFLPAAAQSQTPPVAVGLELSLLIDVSGSVDAGEYTLQMTGYQVAFNNVAVQNAIAANPTGSIAVNVIQWSGGSQQSQSIGWTQVFAGTAGAFGDSIAALVRAFSGSTAPGSAINFAAPLFASNGFTANRWVIDVSGDGAQNSGADTSDARDAFISFGSPAKTINGIVIGGEAGLLSFYTNNVIGGPGAFVDTAVLFTDFAGIITGKLEREIKGGVVPEPSTYGLIGAAALLALVVVRRVRR